MRSSASAERGSRRGRTRRTRAQGVLATCEKRFLFAPCENRRQGTNYLHPWIPPPRQGDPIRQDRRTGEGAAPERQGRDVGRSDTGQVASARGGARSGTEGELYHRFHRKAAAARLAMMMAALTVCATRQ